MKTGRLVLVDGLSGLFERSDPLSTGPVGAAHTSPVGRPVRGQKLPTHGMSNPAPSAPTPDVGSGTTLRLDLSADGSLSGGRLGGLYSTISKALNGSSSLSPSPEDQLVPKPLLVLDHPDLLLPTTSLPAWELWEWIIDLREVCRAAAPLHYSIYNC